MAMASSQMETPLALELHLRRLRRFLLLAAAELDQTSHHDSLC